MARKILSLKVKRKKESLPVTPPSPAATVTDPITRFQKGVAIHPSPCLRLESGSNSHTARAIDLLAPIGMGQRALIVAPPGCGKTTLLKNVCQAVATAYPDISVYALLIDERPEEVTDFKRSVSADVHASSSDESYDHHVRVANKLLDIARKKAGEGEDVMIVIDSLTRLSRVHNAKAKNNGRTLSGGIGAGALEIPRKIFGAARNIENGGSLTILATILVDTGSQMDQVIFEEFKGTGNMEITLLREAANQRVFPAIDIAKSGTRKEELLLDSSEMSKIKILRRELIALKPLSGAKKLVELFNEYPTNKDMLNA